MAFRANEAASIGFEKAKNYLIPTILPPVERERSERVLLEIVDTCGPVVDLYPTWHPLVSNHDEHYPERHPSTRCGYEGLDHTICFVNGFITCPYADGDKVINSVENLPYHPRAEITAEKLNIQLYNKSVTPILVRCEWSHLLEPGKMIPQNLAVPLMLEQEVPAWRWSDCGETWDTMRPYLLGSPHGKRSSLFVSQETALALKKLYTAMTQTGMFGPIMA